MFCVYCVNVCLWAVLEILTNSQQIGFSENNACSGYFRELSDILRSCVMTWKVDNADIW